MADIKPFKAIRPRSELAMKVASKPYDVLSSDEARVEVGDNAFSYLRIVKSEIDLDPSVDVHSDEVYAKAKENFQYFQNEGVLVQDSDESYYLYRLTWRGKSQTGIVAVSSIDDYFNDVIKKHEFTREDKEKDRITHVDTVGANTGPVFMTYRKNDELSKIIENCTKEKDPDTFFILYEVQHQIWKVSDSETVKKIQNHFAQMNEVYIADGHHRTAAAAKVGQLRRERAKAAGKEVSGSEPFNHFLSVLFPDSELQILDYNRLVHDRNGKSTEELLAALESEFDVISGPSKEEFKPANRHEFGMFSQGQWYGLKAKDSAVDENDPVLSLDVSILQEKVLKPILGIKDVRTDNRIEFIGGIRGLRELEDRSTDETVAFSMYPTSIQELMRISDAGKVMPPKSTWFEPKLLSGLFTWRLD